MILNLIYDSSVGSAPVAFTAALNAAVSFFQDTFLDPVTVNIAVGYGEVNGQPLGSNALGSSLTYFNHYSYSQVRSALAVDAISADDASSAGSLPLNNPNGGNYWMTTAQAKAVGLQGPSSHLDGYVGFTSSPIFDFDNTNGISAGQYDFFGVIAHEISEVMGRQLMTGARIGGAPGYGVMDLFHFSSPGVHSFVGAQSGYFSVDNGATNLDNFNTNPNGDYGDWAGSAGNDAFLAFSHSGVVDALSATDLKLMDVLGWDLFTSSGSVSSGSILPDLTATNLVLSPTSVSFDINNIGSGNAAASAASVYLSTDPNLISGGMLLATIASSSLAGGGVDHEISSITLPDDLTPGLYFVGAVANSGNQITESDETNNTSNACMVLLGNSADNLLTGTSANDTVMGFGGNDTYVYTSGQDYFDGGSGSNTLDLSRMTSAIWFGFNEPSGIEAWTRNTADTFHGTWRPLVDTISVENVIGTAYDDRIYGDGNNNTYTYTGGMDLFFGGGGNDTLDLSRMNSAIWFGFNEPTGIEAWTRDATDTFHGTWRPLVDTTSVENVIGTAYDDRIYGDGNNNTYSYTGGMDLFFGGGGSDTLDLSRMNSAIWFGFNEPSGIEAWTRDTADTFHGTWRPLVDTTSVENVIGTAYPDRIRGDAGPNQITGGGGSDLLNGMGGGDTFIYRAVADSTGANYDVITGFNAATDKFDFPFAVTGVDATVGSGSLSTASFDTDLAAAIGAGQLASHHASLFDVSVGSLAGDIFLVVDANGIPGYQAGQDHVFQLDQPTNLLSLSTSDF